MTNAKKTTNNHENVQLPRKGCKDMWNAFMVVNADFTLGSDIPFCPCTAKEVPKKLISYVDAKHLHKITIEKNPDYHYDAFIHFYIDDQKFDGPRSGIWVKPYEALKIIRHFAGVITPDFSTNADFPDPIKRYNTYRMRAFGYWLTTYGISVINNVRWGTEETWDYCFDGIPCNSIVAIGTVASGINRRENRPDFDSGIHRMKNNICPRIIILYGSANHDCFRDFADTGIKIFPFPSETFLAFKDRKGGTLNV